MIRYLAVVLLKLLIIMRDFHLCRSQQSCSLNGTSKNSKRILRTLTFTPKDKNTMPIAQERRLRSLTHPHIYLPNILRSQQLFYYEVPFKFEQLDYIFMGITLNTIALQLAVLDISFAPNPHAKKQVLFFVKLPTELGRSCMMLKKFALHYHYLTFYF